LVAPLNDVLPDTIRKFSALAAQRMGPVDRDVRKRGMWADIVVSAPDQVRDVANFENPNLLSAAMRYVFVNDGRVIDAGKAADALLGKVLRGPGYQAPH
jgi:N-acyl-D-amino-acid deacylase